MKHCPRCDESKVAEDFYKSKAAADGLSSYCRACSKAYSAVWSRKNLTPEKRQKYKQTFEEKNPGYATKAWADWAKRNPEKVREKERRKHEKRMKAKHGPQYVVGAPENRKGNPNVKPRYVAYLTPEEKAKRRRARVTCKRWIAKGKLVPEPCFCCGEKAEAHHYSYDAPDSVVWLCKKHHSELHTAHREQIG